MNENEKSNRDSQIETLKNRAAGIPHPTVLVPHEVRLFKEIPAKKEDGSKPLAPVHYWFTTGPL